METLGASLVQRDLRQDDKPLDYCTLRGIGREEQGDAIGSHVPLLIEHGQGCSKGKAQKKRSHKLDQQDVKARKKAHGHRQRSQSLAKIGFLQVVALPVALQ